MPTICLVVEIYLVSFWPIPEVQLKRVLSSPLGREGMK